MPTTASGLVYPDQSGSVDAAADLAALAQAMEAAFGWKAYTPTLTATGLGTSPTVTGRYQQMGKRVRGWAKVTLGSSPSPSGVPSLSLPVPAASGESVMCTAKALSTGNNIFWMMADATATAVAAGVSIVSGMGALSSSTPFTWKSGDVITVTYDYEAA